jgi:hypothetical protein
MNTDKTVSIRRMSDYTDLDPNTGTPRTRRRVEWMYGTHGPFVDYFPAADFDGMTARAALDQKARQLDAIAGT